MNERTLFTTALEKENPAQRQAYLDEACAGNTVLRERIDALLRSHQREGQFLDVPAVEQIATASVTRTETTPEADETPSLAFLTPSDKPGSLGCLEHYEVQEVVGHGGMGIVLKAFDEELHRIVAIKVMAAQLATSATARKRFKREAQAAAAVSHDHIVTIHAVDDAGELPYLVMQYVAGTSLQERLEQDGPLDLMEILRIGMQTASGLAAAHAQGLVHRDIKPANILLENGVERVKITDFGLARAAADASVTQSGIIAGTPQYMAPEQAQGDAVDGRADLFSLGSVLYAMCTGRAPFRASGTVAVLKRVCEEAPTPIHDANPEIPEWLVAIIDKLHAKDPAERFQSAAEVAELLSRHLAHVQHPTGSNSRFQISDCRFEDGASKPFQIPNPKSQTRHRQWSIPAAAAVLLILLSGLSLTEATGVTSLRATVVRVFTPDGTLIVETNDPALKVTVEGDGGLVITGAGLEEIRVRPGNYKVYADKDGKPVPLERQLVSVATGGREVVRVKLESPLVVPSVQAGKGAFVVLAPGGEHKFDTLAEAVQGASDGDTIEIRGNGPFFTTSINFNRALLIRAGAGFRPVVKAYPDESARYLIQSNAPLVMEGLDLQWSEASKHEQLLSPLGTLAVANCRFFMPIQGVCIGGRGSDWMVRNCDLSSPSGAGMSVECRDGNKTVVSNCLVVGHTNLSDFDVTLGGTVRFNSNTFLTGGPATTALYYITNMPRAQATQRPAKRLIVSTSENVFDSERSVVNLFQPLEFRPHLTVGEAEKWLPRRVEWREVRNLYALGRSLLRFSRQARDDTYEVLNTSRGQDLTDWNGFWDLKDTGSSQRMIRFHGGDLRAKVLADAAKLTPDDFRLRPDSAGYRAGPDGKDLGADVDLVGPGQAYERWKKMPEYQEWLKETGQMK